MVHKMTIPDVEQVLRRTDALVHHLGYLDEGQRLTLARKTGRPYRVTVVSLPAGEEIANHHALNLLGNGGELHHTIPGAHRDLRRTNGTLTAWLVSQRHDEQARRALGEDPED